MRVDWSSSLAETENPVVLHQTSVISELVFLCAETKQNKNSHDLNASSVITGYMCPKSNYSDFDKAY